MSTDPAAISDLIQRAERAFNTGQRSEAGRLLQAALALAPTHPTVLNALGVLELQQGNYAAALTHVQQAIAQEPGNAAIWINQASILRKLGRREEELTALERVLGIEPRHLPALLQKASLFEQLGRGKEAATTYHNALQSVPAHAQLPASLRTALQHAAQVVDANQAALAAFIDAQLGEQFGDCTARERVRFDRCIDLLVGKRGLYLPQPTFMYFPQLPALEFYERDEFAWLAELEAHTAEIRSEFESVYAGGVEQLEPYVQHPSGVPLDQWAELNHSRRWGVYFLWKDGQPQTEHLAQCPRTAAVLSRMPTIEIRGYAPAAFFSVLAAKSHIPAHTGVTNTRLIVHLPLIVPAGCRFRVGAETRSWEPGRALIFDDTIEHEAWNDSDQPRAVLIFDIWNPYLTDQERALISTATAAVKQYYKGGGPLGGAS